MLRHQTARFAEVAKRLAESRAAEIAVLAAPVIAMILIILLSLIERFYQAAH
jgi:hypothetical protein